MVKNCRNMKLIIKKKDKKGWLKILEAVIAVLIIIAAVVYILSSSVPKRDITAVAYEKEKYILNTISKDDNLRSKIIADDNNDVDIFIKKMIPLSWDFETKICGIEDICESTLKVPNDKDVYASEVVITSDLSIYSPKKLRLFIWKK